MAIAVKYPVFRPLPQATAAVAVTPMGPKNGYHTLVYLYGDVVEELLFNARERDAYGVLTGKYALIRRSADEGLQRAQDFIEITAFKDVFPTDEALDYAHYLRRQRNYRNDSANIPLGLAVMRRHFTAPSLEDLMVMRSYFDMPNQIALFIDGSGRRGIVYMLDDVDESFAEIGYSVIHLSEAPCPLVEKKQDPALSIV